MRTPNSVRTVLATGVAGFAVTGMLAVTAQGAAAASTSPVNAAADVAASAARQQPVSAMAVKPADVQLSVGKSGSAPLTLRAGDRQVQFELPDVGAVSTIRAANGTDVRRGAKATDLVVAARPGGAQVMAVLHNASASTTQRYRIPGAHLQLQADGSILIRTADGQDGQVAAPWARDANGRQLPSHYEVDGDVLVQITDTTGAAFPVVADPSVSFGWYIYVRFSKSEVQGLYGKVLRGELDWATAACGFIKAPYNIVCGAGLASYTNSIKGTWQNAYNNHQCMEYRINYTPQVLVGWRNYNC